MPRLTTQPYQVLIRLFKEDGFSIKRQSSRHILLTKEGIDRPLVIPMYADVGIDIIKSNMKSAGMDRKRYFELLNRVK